MTYPREKFLGPQNTREKKNLDPRNHAKAQRHDGTTHAEFSALFQERLILFMYYYM